MTLKFVTGRNAVKFHHKDDAMTVAWDLDASLEGDELLEALRRIVSFMDAQTGREPLPERIPGMALGMAQTQYPRLVEVTEEEGVAMKKARPGSVTNGWAPYAGTVPAPPAIPEGAEYELIPPEEQG
jgi:hypothetical protein